MLKHEQLTAITLSVFRLNGLLIEWGNRLCAPHGLSSARWQVLGAIALAPQAPSAPQIAASMGMTRQGMQKQINLLIRDGLVQAERNPGNKRSPLYALTEHGAALYRALEQDWRRHVERLGATFTVAELDATLGVLASLEQAHPSYPKEST